jgi:hypothetical protein
LTNSELEHFSFQRDEISRFRRVIQNGIKKNIRNFPGVYLGFGRAAFKVALKGPCLGMMFPGVVGFLWSAFFAAILTVTHAA